MPDPSASPGEQRRGQILAAAMACFARRGFHQTTMNDISQEAGISVGLIYRYFENKEQVIAAMAGEHRAEVRRRLEEARGLPSLSEALEKVLFCDQHDPGVAASFVVDLFAESARNEQVRELVRSLHDAIVEGVAELVASSAEAALLAPGVSPREAANVAIQIIHGEMFDEILRLGSPAAGAEDSPGQARTRTLQRVQALLFPARSAAAPSAAGTRS